MGNNFLREVQRIRVGNKGNNIRQKEEPRGRLREGLEVEEGGKTRDRVNTRSWSRANQ